MAWSQMNLFGKGLEVGIALFKTFFSGLLFAIPIAIIPAIIFQPSHDWIQANRSVLTWVILSLSMSISILRTATYYWAGIPEIEQITREKKWDDWVI